MKNRCIRYEAALINFGRVLAVWLSLSTPAIVMAQTAASPQTQQSDTVAAVMRQALAGDASAEVKLGRMYENGLGVGRSYAYAIAWYQKAAAQGNTDAENNLGTMYQNGLGVQRDYAQAMVWYQKAAGQGNADAENNLGVMYHNGLGVQKDYAQAIGWYQQAAAQDNGYAENNLGVIYQHGLGVQQDYAQAIVWYKKAAAQGNPIAKNNLGEMYQNGLGVEKDNAQAIVWYQQAAAQGNAAAEDNLGWMYLNGTGIKLDDMQAIAWFQKAAAQGNAPAENTLGWMYQNGLGIQQDYTQAIAWYRRSAAQGNADAENSLGWMYKNGFGVQQDSAQAITWYQKAIAQGNSNATKNLDALNREIAKGELPTTNATTTPAAQTSGGDLCDLSKDSSDGVAIVSGTLPPGFTQFAYVYKPGDGFKDRPFKERTINVGLDRGHIASDFTAVSGKLFILRLPAGTYNFQGWWYLNATEQVWPKGIHPLTFNVAAGRAIYLGGFDPIGLEEKKGLLHVIQERAWVLVHDDHSRDLPVFFARCPGFGQNLLDVRVMDTTPWLPPPRKK